MKQIGTEGILIIVGILTICFGAIIWGHVRKAHGKSDRLTSWIIDDIRNGKPYRTLVKAEIVNRRVKRSSIRGSLTGAILSGLTGRRQKIRGNTTFRLIYEDGHASMETVMDHTLAWEKYMKFVSK